MSTNKIRSSQAINSFGPGAMLDLPDSSVIVGGLEGWKYEVDQEIPLINEPRLVDKLRGILEIQSLTLRKPPVANEQAFGARPSVKCYRFPEWFIVQRTETTKEGYRKRRLVHLSALERMRFTYDDRKKEAVVPMRFVRSCRKGHVDDIDWVSFAHAGDKICARCLWFEEGGTSGDLSEIQISCDCGKSQSLAAALNSKSGTLGCCNGRRPWLGPYSREKCGEPSRLLIRTASNAYFAQIVSVISIPEAQSAVENAVRALWSSYFIAVKAVEQIATFRLIPQVAAAISAFSDDEIWKTVKKISSGNKETRFIKDVEFDALTTTKAEIGHDVPDGIFYARSLPKGVWDAPWMAGIKKVVLVHRLREVVAQVGFTRFEPASPDIHGEFDLEVIRASIALETSWLPACENIGEGIFLEFKPEALENWAKKSAVMERGRLLFEGYRNWAKGSSAKMERFPTVVYYLLHSFSHLLLTAIALECGYPASSLRERIYLCPTENEQRGGILIYTGSSDAEGTLGGLVQTGRDIKRHVRVALETGRLCANDPVCAYHKPRQHDHQPLMGAACHGCLLISETSCEQRNVYLDRALVVETVDTQGAEFFEGV
jgi:uncharacterized protein DUF1998